MTCPVFHQNSISETYTNDTTIEIILNEIALNQGLSFVNMEPYIKKFKDNLIFNFSHLMIIPKSMIQRLGLPLVIEIGILNLYKIPEHLQNKSSSNMIENDEKPDTINGNGEKSAMLGLSSENRKILKEVWSKLVDLKPKTQENSDLVLFFNKFYVNFLQIDRVGRKLFKGVPLTAQAQALMKMMKFIMDTLDEPVKLVLPLQKIGATHLIYGVTEKSYTSWATSLVKTLEESLGSEIMNAEAKEVWFNLVQKLASVMLNEYEDLKKGFNGRIYQRSSNESWKLRYSHLNYQKLTLFRDSSRKKISLQVYLNEIEDIDIVDEDSGNKETPTEFSFTITREKIKQAFCFLNEDDMEAWISQLTMFIRAYKRLRLSNEMNEEPSEIRNKSNKKNNAKIFVSVLKNLLKKSNPS